MAVVESVFPTDRYSVQTGHRYSRAGPPFNAKPGNAFRTASFNCLDVGGLPRNFAGNAPFNQ